MTHADLQTLSRLQDTPNVEPSIFNGPRLGYWTNPDAVDCFRGHGQRIECGLTMQ